MLRRDLRAAMLAALMVASMSACSDDPAPDPVVTASESAAAQAGAAAVSGSASDAASGAASGAGAAPGDAAAWTDPAAAAAGAKVGPGTPCPVPFTFAVPAKWTPKAPGSAVEAAGGYLLRCEIDGKPAGVIGFIRVWTATAANPRRGLETYHDGKATDARYRQVPAGGQTIWEVAHTIDGVPKRAFAVGDLLVEWGGLDADEHKDGLPAYILARTTVAAA